MQLIFKLFKELMNHLKYPQKFLLIFIVFFIPIIGTSVFIFYNIQCDINVAKLEKVGLESNLRLQTVVQKIQQHRGLSATFLGGNTKVYDDLLKKEEEIEESFSSFEEYLNANSDLKAFEEGWEHIKEEYAQIDVNQMDATVSFQKHTELISNILVFASGIADDTHLSLESDVVRHHLAKIITDDLIYVTEYMGQARAIGSNVLAQGKMTSQQELDLIFLSKTMTENLNQVQSSMDVVLDKDEQVRQAIANEHKEAIEASKNFSSLIANEILNKEVFSYESTIFFDKATEAIELIFVVIHSNSKMLDGSLDHEISNLTVERNLIVFIDIAAMVLAIVLFISFYHSVKDSITSINRSTAKISDGDLTERIQLKTKDETKEIETSINRMIDAIQNLIKSNQDLSIELSSSAEQLSSSAHECTQASQQIAEITQTVAGGSERQKNAVSEVNSSIQSMDFHINDVSNSSVKMQQMFEHTATSTGQGVQMVQDVLISMNDIHTTVQDTAKVVTNLGESSKRIDNIVALITDISAQTNLLALNAAIEASRAGEHGKGFAVVAEEVRKLAEESKASAEQISLLVRQIRDETCEVVESMARGLDKVNVGLNKVTGVNEVFQNINKAINEVKEMSVSIAHSVAKITKDSKEITATMEKVEQAAENSTEASQVCSAASEEQLATMEEISASAESLSSMAERLRELISKFKV